MTFTLGGSTDRTKKFLQTVGSTDLFKGLDSIGQRGVTALQSKTPVESGLTAASWSFEVTVKDGSTTISWLNSHTVEGVNIAIILQYGHGTGTGGYVVGQDYINPALRPIFDDLANELWKRVTSA